MARVVPQGVIERELAHAPDILEACFRVARVICDVARGIAPIGPGAGRNMHGMGQAQGVLASQINPDHTLNGGRARSHADWSAPVEGGWGIYGRHHHIIQYRNIIDIMVGPRGGLPGGRIVTVGSVKGSPPQPFMSEAARIVAESSQRLTWIPRVPWIPHDPLAP